jgi:hypothetical protein
MELADLPGHPARGAAHQYQLAVEVWLRQHVEQQAPDELMRAEPHGDIAGQTVAPVVFDTERYAGMIRADQAAVRDGNAMRVA